jgi:hypothetical protein
MRERNIMKPKTIILTLLVLMAVAMIPVSAMTITMANPSGVSERDILVYYFNGTAVGLYNSTSMIVIPDPTVDYIFTTKPLNSNPLEDPADFLVNVAFPFVQTNILGLVIMLILIAIWRKG